MEQIGILRNIRYGIKTLMLQKLQSSLTILGIVFGIASVVAMLSIGEGASHEALDQIRKLGSTNILIEAKKVASETSAVARGPSLSIYGLLYEDADRIRETFDTVEQIASVKSIMKDSYLHERTLELRVVGTNPSWFDLVPRDVIAGRVLLRRDVENNANVVVLTEYGARRVLATENTIGQALRIGSDHFEVVGIVKSEGGEGAPDRKVDAYIPLSVAKKYFGDITMISSAGSRIRELVELHQIIVQVRSNEEVVATAKGIGAMLRRFHKSEDYRVNVPLELLRQAEATKKRFNIVLGSIAAISLLVGGIGIMNIMLASVTERTREIGIRRAIGAKRRQIIEQFLIETVVLSTIGGIIGIILGLVIPWFVTYFAKMPTIVTAQSLILSVGISVAIGVIFGLYPAVRAANLDPIAALRHE